LSIKLAQLFIKQFTDMEDQQIKILGRRSYLYGKYQKMITLLKTKLMI